MKRMAKGGEKIKIMNSRAKVFYFWEVKAQMRGKKWKKIREKNCENNLEKLRNNRIGEKRKEEKR